MAKQVTELILIYEGGMPDIANAFAEEFKISQRDVLHLLRREFRKLRESAAMKAKSKARACLKPLKRPLRSRKRRH